MIPKEYDEGAKLKRCSFYYVSFRFVTQYYINVTSVYVLKTAV